MNDGPPPGFDDAPPFEPGQAVARPSGQSRGFDRQAPAARPQSSPAALSADPETQVLMQTLRNSLYPGATWESIAMVLSWCKANKVDPFLKCVHIVPMNVKIPGSRNYEWRDVLMPGIADYRIKASRSGQYVGKSEPLFGPDKEIALGDSKYTVPEWCKVTVTKMVHGQRAEFTSVEYWIENYSTISKDSNVPNKMWAKRPRGQLSKCCEAQALRMAFPEFGGAATAEEMEGKHYEDVEVMPAITMRATPTTKLDQFEQQFGKPDNEKVSVQTPLDKREPPHVELQGVASADTQEGGETPSQPSSDQAGGSPKLPPAAPDDPLGSMRGKTWGSIKVWYVSVLLRVAEINDLETLEAFQVDPEFADRLDATRGKAIEISRQIDDAIDARRLFLTPLGDAA